LAPVRVLLTACAVAATITATTARGAPPFRLPGDAVPKRYSAELVVDPRSSSIGATLELELDVRRGVDTLWLDAEGLTVQRAQIHIGKSAMAARVLTGDRHLLGFAFDKPLPTGPARLHIEYRAPLSATETAGATRQRDGDDDYVFTQFAAIDARRVFPCFDEPGFKVPWRVALIVPVADRALFNTPQIAERTAASGWKRVEFAETPPLPSYLIAFAVGPFDVVDAGRSSSSGTPIRIIAPRGKRDRTTWAAAVSHQALERLEAYFGTPSPFSKLDNLAVPRTSYGAMENPGLITYAATLLLADPATQSIGHRREYVDAVTHEFSHQWFGNLVTMKWWDDTWLNEAFATWITQKIIEAWQPSWGADVTRVEERNSAMAADSLANTRPVRRPVRSYDDIRTIYDAITYQKGARIIGMFERLIGAEVFQRGVRQYLADHARGNADANDFMGAISHAAGRDFASAFSSFLDQPGVPVVAVQLDCQSRPPRLNLQQRRYHHLGSTAVTEQRWQIPICARWPGGRSCTLLSEPRGTLTLVGAKECPAWVEANDTGAGYYRVASDAKLLRDGISELTVAEKLALWSDSVALSNAGEVDFADVLQLAERLAADPDRHVLGAVLDFVSSFEDRGLVARSDLTRYHAWLARLLGARARALGLVPGNHDDDETRLLRARLVPTFAASADDSALTSSARALASAWLGGDRHAIERDLLGGVLAVAARRGGTGLWEAYVKAARATTDPDDRLTLLWAVGQFRDPALVTRSLAIIAGNDFDPRDALVMFWGATEAPQTRALAWSWMREHFDALATRLPRDVVASLAAASQTMCDESAVEPTRVFFAPRMKQVDGGASVLESAIERVKLCAAERKAHAPVVSHYLH
jgi:alanyl aminopeptidase